MADLDFQREGVVLVLGGIEEKVKVDFAEQLKEGHEVVGWTLDSPRDFGWMFQHQYRIANGGLYTVYVKEEYEAHKADYDAYLEAVEDQKQLVLTNMHTTVSIGKSFIDTYILNLPAMVVNPGVSHLEDTYRGCTAVVCSAGPSLDMHLETIRTFRDNVVLIVVDMALQTLVKKGIYPDFIVGIDPMEENAGMFKGMKKFPPLVAIGQYTPSVVRSYKGPIYLIPQGSNPIWGWMGHLIGDKGYIDCQGGSVSHLAYSLAEFLGCNQIGLAGFDHSWKAEGNYHSGGGWKGYKADGIPAKDINGEDVLTSGLLIQFRNGLEDRIKLGHTPTFHCGLTGLPIKGAENRTLHHFMSHSGWSKPVPKPVDALKSMTPWSPIKDELEQAVAALSAINKECRKAVKLIPKLQAMRPRVDSKQHKDFHKLMKGITECQRIARDTQHPILNIVAAYHMVIEVYLQREASKEINTIKDSFERIDKQFERGMVYYTEIETATRKLKRTILKVLRSRHTNPAFSNKAEEQGAAGAGRLTLPDFSEVVNG
jgi:hypothetical protein